MSAGATAAFRVSDLASWAPLLIPVLILLWLCWRDPDVEPSTGEDDRPEPPVFDAPPLAPTMASMEQIIRNADRG